MRIEKQRIQSRSMRRSVVLVILFWHHGKVAEILFIDGEKESGAS